MMAGRPTRATPPVEGGAAKHFLHDNNTEGTLCHETFKPSRI